MSASDLRATFLNTERAFMAILPLPVYPQANPVSSPLSWRQMLPLDGLFVAGDEAAFIQFKNKWETFLNALDQLWNRLNAFAIHGVADAHRQQAIRGYLGNINAKRSEDELLRYLDKARNSAHHSLWRHIRSAKASEVLSDTQGGTIEVQGDQIILRESEIGGARFSEMVVLREGAMLLKEVEVIEKKKRLKIALPRKHDGQDMYVIDGALPHMVGKMGLLFYERVLASVLQKAGDR